MEGFFMPDYGALHAYDTLLTVREGPSAIEMHRETMQTSRKTMGPATDQGNAVQLLTTEEVALWLQVAPKTLRNWRSAGLGPTALKLQSVVRYDRAAVDAWIGKTSRAAA
jgi:predicted DNA-binding transcriptional regulator AlpA